ncbi:MAG: Rieske (2Fe-2S) protein [Actinomycetota bacterium]|nr:Rieske (2Fe-2S) protein [Actinomycetota bacterium]
MTDVVGNIDTIPIGEGRAFVVDGRQIAVFHLRGGSFRALDAVCPHRGGPLADGLLDGSVVVCPLHGHTFDLLSGEDVAGGGSPVTAYDVDVDGRGGILIKGISR